MEADDITSNSSRSSQQLQLVPEDHGKVAGAIASLIAQRLATHVSPQRAAQHVKMPRSPFRIPGLELVVAHIEQPAMLAFPKPLRHQPIYTLSGRDHIFGWLRKVERMRESAAGDEKGFSAKPPYRFSEYFSQSPMGFSRAMPPNRARHDRNSFAGEQVDGHPNRVLLGNAVQSTHR